MKRALKYFLARTGLYKNVQLIRHLPAIVRWIDSGCTGIAPAPIKWKVVTSYLRSNDIKTFVETGTYLGNTLAIIAFSKRIRSISIELAEEYHVAAKRRFKSYNNVTLYQGDSSKVLPQIVASLQVPALFWLDGHYSGGRTAGGDAESPIRAELDAILMSPSAKHVILIDDVRCLDGTRGYPFLDELLALIREDGRYQIEVSADILRLTPKQ